MLRTMLLGRRTPAQGAFLGSLAGVAITSLAVSSFSAISIQIVVHPLSFPWNDGLFKALSYLPSFPFHLEVDIMLARRREMTGFEAFSHIDVIHRHIILHIRW